MPGETAAVERVFREEYGRLIASLVRRFGDIDIAEEAAGEALVAALEKWPESGVPPNPGGWLTTTAGNRAIDRIRRENQRDAKHQAAFMYYDDTPHEPTGPVEEEDRIGEGALPGARGRRPPRAARRRAGGAVPRLQRGLPRHRRWRPGSRRAHGRGHPADEGPPPAAPRAAGGGRS